MAAGDNGTDRWDTRGGDSRTAGALPGQLQMIYRACWSSPVIQCVCQPNTLVCPSCLSLFQCHPKVAVVVTPHVHVAL